VRTTGLGNVHRYTPKSTKTSKTRPVAVWSVTSESDVFFLTKLFDRYSLRTRKVKDYAVWRRAVHFMSRHPHSRGSGFKEVMARFKAELEDVRRYRPPSDSGRPDPILVQSR
jgi:hypothetical protein